MNIVFFSHPAFLEHKSMNRYSQMLAKGMQERGHQVEVLMPHPKFFRSSLPTVLRKWLGYVDQFLAFPREVRQKLEAYSTDTLFVFTDHALGPWVPLVAKQRPHLIHCHDFLAQRSALGEIPENPTSWTGKQYQAYIRRGYTKGKNFISVSQKSKADLHRFLSGPISFSETVYNGLDSTFGLTDQVEARQKLGQRIGADLSEGFLLHVGGNQWYKNRIGVIEIYHSWRTKKENALPLLLVGEAPDKPLLGVYNQSPYKEQIHFCSGLEDNYVWMAYAGASVFLFPSLAEGFGWPIAEAMASGCPVITTAEAPMTEVAGEAAFLIPRRPAINLQTKAWANDAAQIIDKVLTLSPAERKRVVEKGLCNAKRFDPEVTLNSIEAIYLKVLQAYGRKEL